ncbi:MAG: tRNA (adenosine(37)-N6)-threonylcarbamoyltransferase complex transferase subunit TsaD [Nitrospinae bacterium]|nr:tRNA (adenosine(37)-N6)-threonylcarbamoyltransferase complex transferase subunit TsaD [Nitrospinota bacterium]
MERELITLGIETSCDETAVALLRGRAEILASVVASQTDLHEKYGGVVPELACRRHVETLPLLVREAFARAGIGKEQVGLVAVTQGPGLVGALLVGLSYAKAFAWARRLPLVPVNHIEGHLAAGFVARPDTPLPAVALIVSGGHSELFHMERPGALVKLGSTRDDAAGEAYDKVARLLGLGYPGGPVMDRLAREGRAVYPLPVALHGADTLDFSFSGLKTAVKNLVRALEKEGAPLPVADIASSFQRAVVEALIRKTRLALERVRPASLIVGGGVASNSALRAAVETLGKERGVVVTVPPLELCADNAVMIAASGAMRYLADPANPAWRDFLALDALPSWPVGE